MDQNHDEGTPVTDISVPVTHPHSDDWYVPPPPDSHPILATIIGVIALIFIFSQPANSGAPSDLAYLLGIVLGAIGMVWGIGYAVTIKHASMVWKVVSFIIIAIVATLGALAQMGVRNARSLADARATFASLDPMMERANTGEIPDDLPVGEGGPMQRMLSAFANSMLADTRAFDNEAEASGMYKVIALEGFERNSPILRNCGRIGELEQRSEENYAHFDNHVAAARRVGDAAVRNGEISSSEQEAFLEGAIEGKLQQQRVLRLNGEMASHAASLCRILASHHWVRDASGRVLLSDDAALAEASRHLERVSAIGTEVQAIQQRARSNINRIGAEITAE